MRFSPANLLVFVIIYLLAGCASEKEGKKFTGYVNPLIGTGGHGHTFPGATMPFGMVQLSPDTRLEGWDGCSGYHNSDSIIYGFSHTHLSGTGVADYCDILLMPTVGEIQFDNGYNKGVSNGYASRFQKETEKASPGFYAVYLEDYNIDVQLTATERAGFHKYTFNKGDKANVIIDLTHRDKLLNFDLSIVNNNEIEGFRISESWAREQRVYFVAMFSKPFSGNELMGEVLPLDNREHKRARMQKAALSFDVEEGETILVKVGISPVSIENARRNLEAEISHWSFEKVRTNADSTWERALCKIEAEGGTEEQKTIFYTALYHSMIAPNLFTDVNNEYRGMDGKIHKTDNTRVYTVFSLWDTFRATHPLYTIIEQKRTSEFIQTFLKQYEQGGRLPVWELAGNETECMIGYHSVPVIADAFSKGIRDFDVEKALKAMTSGAELNHFGLKYYRKNGCIMAGEEAESVSKTLEYAYDDWCIALIAKATGNENVYSDYLQRAQYYKNLFNPKTGFFHGRMHGGWFSPFDPAEVNFNYTEANAWQYSLFVPQDITGLIKLMGGAENFEQHLDNLFVANSQTTGRHQSDITGLIGQYAHGNEPSHHMAYLYSYIGKPWKTQQRVRQIMDEMYSARPDGLSGNEDCGQMSAWYVLSAMGFYSVTPGLPYYAIGTPIFDKVTINLEHRDKGMADGKKFTVEAKNISDENIYIQSATLNGEVYTKSFLLHEDMMKGGELLFEMGPSPNESWGNLESDRPKSEITANSLLPIPYINTVSNTFTDSLRIEMGAACDACVIVYAKNETVPFENGILYENPFFITETTTLTVASMSENLDTSVVISYTYKKIDGSRSIALHCEYANQYAAGGDNALIDYQRGSDNYRTGYWQGYQGQDLEAVVDLGELRRVDAVTIGLLQDIKSWIWYPAEVSFSTSRDGNTWSPELVVKNAFPDDEYGAFTQEFSSPIEMKTRYIKVRAKNYGACPEWHLGAGGKTWIFADEIVID